MRELYVDTREGAACFRTISEAVASLPSENEELTVIHVAPGIYEYKFVIDGTWCAVSFTRDGEWLSLPVGLAFYQGQVFKIMRQ